MKCEEIIKIMEEVAPIKYAEKWDNPGLLSGDREKEVRKVMIALDSSQRVIEQAVIQKVDMLITHHPLIFKPINNISADNFIGRKIVKLVSNDIAYYATHTNMDVAVMAQVASDKIELCNTKPLEVVFCEKLYKIAVFVPIDSADKVRNAMTREGAGFIGKYSDCTFNTQGTGTYKAHGDASPYIGKVGELESTKEVKIETVVTKENMHKVINSMIKVHPYEEVAYDIYELSNDTKCEGIGKYGYLPSEMKLSELAEVVKRKFGIKTLRICGNPDKKVVTAAISPGAGKSMIEYATKAKVDVIITGDIDHHAALDAIEQNLCVIDAGHFGTEYFVVDCIKKYLNERIYGEAKNGPVYVNPPEIVIADEADPYIYI